MDNIFFKLRNPYDYIQNRCFLRQTIGQKVILFKMLLYRPTSGVDLVRCMQPRGNLQKNWLMFDHVKHVREWTTMACNVYDPM